MPLPTRFVWALLAALLAALAIVAFHAVVLARFTDTLGPVVAWCLATFGIVALGGRLARHPAIGAHPWATPWKRLDGEALVVIALLLVLFAAFHVSFTRAASDGRELFVQVRSLVIDGDFDFSNENAVFGVRGTAGVYPPGATLLWAPFHAMGHLWLGVLNIAGAEHVRDGYTNPYQRAVGLGTYVYGALALVLIYGLVRRYFGAAVTLLAWSAVVFGSSVAWYIAVESSMAHGLALFAVTLFIVVWDRTRGRRTRPGAFLLGLTAGLMMLVRWENALFFLLPALEWLLALVAILRRRSPQRAADLARQWGFVAAGVLLALLPLIPFWSAAPQGQPADVLEYHRVGDRGLFLLEVLFSPDHGLFSWTPVIYLAAMGLPLFVSRDRFLGWGLLLCVVAATVTYASIGGWDGGSGFGARRFTVCALPFTLGLAALVDEARRRPLGAVTVLLGVFVTTNVFVMGDMRAGKLNPGQGLSFDRVFEAAYSRVGNPFSFPANFIFSVRYDASSYLYDRLGVHRYSNLLIDIGSPGDDDYLLDGWSNRENDGGQTFRWAVTTRSRLIVPLRGREKILRLRLAPFVFVGATAQHVEVVINGQTVGQFEARPGMHDYDVSFSRPELWEPVSVEFRYAWARSPLEVGVSDDARPLSVQIDYLRFEPEDRSR